MVAQKIFVSCIITLVLFNFIFYVSGLNPELLNTGNLIGIFVSLGVIVVIAAVVPTVSGGGTVKWFAWSLIMLGLFYSVTFQVLGKNIPIGFGLASNLTNMFSGDLESISFMPWLFFTAIGMIGVISGIVMTGGGSSE